ncbi:MAG: glycosyltransferase 87 family protein [Desulfosporosinus sp.]|nr:glycosyltransferase 87 family protein [Desulfosporosinus sp.]
MRASKVCSNTEPEKHLNILKSSLSFREFTHKKGDVFLLKTTKNKFTTTLYKKSTFEIVFITAIFILSFFFMSGLCYSDGQHQRELLFSDRNDYFMDYFNPMKYISEANPYNNTYLSLGEKVYPPLAYMILYPFSKLFDYVTKLPSQGRADQLGIMSLVFILAISSVVYGALLYELKNGRKVIRWLTVSALFLSGVYIFSLERANIIILSAILLTFFLLFYNSHNKVLREISLIALALAAALKIFPALFGLILLYDKRYKDVCKLVIYGLIAVFLPFIFFKGGFENVPYLIRNMRANSQNYTDRGFQYRFGFIPISILFSGLKHISVEFSVNLGKLISISYLIITIIASFSLYKRWKTILMLTCALVSTPLNSGFYCGLYLFAPIVLFLNDDQHESGDWFYMIFMILALNPYQVSIANSSISGVISNIAVLLIYTRLCFEGISAIKYRIMNRNDKLIYS